MIKKLKNQLLSVACVVRYILPMLMETFASSA